MKPFESAQDRSAGRPSDDSTIDVPQVATFEGTFAATARPKSQTPRPWYRDRAYLLEGWLDIPIWKSAVRTPIPAYPSNPGHWQPDYWRYYANLH